MWHPSADDLQFDEQDRDDRPAPLLDDEVDRDELRRRYYGLLQELRVLLPGVQILVAFLLTVPFATRFPQLSTLQRDLFGLALTTGVVAVVAFTTPTVFHRLGDRQARSERLVWGVRVVVVGLFFMAISLLAALAVVATFVFSAPVALAMVATVTLAVIGGWVVLPLTGDRVNRRGREDPRPPDPTRGNGHQQDPRPRAGG